jgi:hypothetical protein
MTLYVPYEHDECEEVLNPGKDDPVYCGRRAVQFWTNRRLRSLAAYCEDHLDMEDGWPAWEGPFTQDELVAWLVSET